MFNFDIYRRLSVNYMYKLTTFQMQMRVLYLEPGEHVDRQEIISIYLAL